MPRYLRGAVVMRGHRYGVVWSHDARGLVLLPIDRPDREGRGDVLLDLSDLIACGTPVAHAAIRPAPFGPVAPDRQVQVGTVPGPVMCRVVQALVRLAAETAAIERWSGDRAHQARERRSAVKMVG